MRSSYGDNETEGRKEGRKEGGEEANFLIEGFISINFVPRAEAGRPERASERAKDNSHCE